MPSDVELPVGHDAERLEASSFVTDSAMSLPPNQIGDGAGGEMLAGVFGFLPTMAATESCARCRTRRYPFAPSWRRVAADRESHRCLADSMETLLAGGVRTSVLNRLSQYLREPLTGGMRNATVLRAGTGEGGAASRRLDHRRFRFLARWRRAW